MPGITISALPDLERLPRREPVATDFAVEGSGCPASKRSWLASVLAAQEKLSTEATESALDQLPVCLGSNLTRGQAEALVALLQREQIDATLRQLVG